LPVMGLTIRMGILAPFTSESCASICGSFLSSSPLHTLLFGT